MLQEEVIPQLPAPSSRRDVANCIENTITESFVRTFGLLFSTRFEGLPTLSWWLRPTCGNQLLGQSRLSPGSIDEHKQWSGKSW